MILKQDTDNLFARFQDMRVMVIGDVMVDTYIFGDVTRISPEAPVPIVEVNRRANHLGGAANVALNIKALGGEPILCGVVGEDEKGDLFYDLMKKRSLDSDGILRSDKRPTTTKFRIFGSTTQLLRVDEESTNFLNNIEQHLFVETLKKIIETKLPDIIIFQDYDKGVISRELISEINSFAKKRSVPVIADPKRRNFSAYKDITMLKPNLKELKEGFGIEVDPTDKKQLFEAVAKFKKEYRLDYAMITLSEHGVIIAHEKSGEICFEFVPAHHRKISDVSGAGDTVISVAALCMAAGLSPRQIAEYSNLAGGLVCEQVGVIPVDKEKFHAEIVRINS